MDSYLSQVFGFLFLALPPTYLLSLSFSDYEYSFKKKTLYSIIYCADVLCALTIPLLYVNHAMEWVFRILLIADALFSLLVYSYLLRAPVQKKILGVVPSVFYLFVIFLLRTIIGKGSAPLLSGGYRWIDVLFLLCLLSIFLPLDIVFIKKKVQPALAVMNVQTLRHECMYFTICVIGYSATLLLYIFLINNSWTYVSPIFLIAMLIISCMYYFILHESTRNNELEYQKKITETRILQYRKLELEIDKARRQQHDETHFLTQLYTLLEKGKYDEARTYMEHITKHHSLLLHEDFCTNRILNNLLQYYIGWAESLHVKHEVHVLVPEYILDEDDLCVLFGNLLEDALLRLEHMPDDQRTLRIHAEVYEDNFLLSVEHSCAYIQQSHKYEKRKKVQSSEAFNPFLSRDTIGMKSTEKIAKKYNGNAEFSFDSNKQEFTSRILLKWNEQSL